jgi:hypothetical protein
MRVIIFIFCLFQLISVKAQTTDSSIAIWDRIFINDNLQAKRIVYLFVKDTSSIIFQQFEGVKYPLLDVDEVPMNTIKILVFIFTDNTWMDGKDINYISKYESQFSSFGRRIKKWK